jgi:predicted nucleotide-binding protein
MSRRFSVLQKEEIVDTLQSYRDRLTGEVLQAYATRGSTYGNERFAAWRRKFSKFLDDNLPGESSRLSSKLHHLVYSIHVGESDAQRFWRTDGEIVASFIDSLIVDIQAGEYEAETKAEAASEESEQMSKEHSINQNRVFIVHGHDELVKTQTARFIEKLGFEAIILHEQASRGKTIIEKIETYTNVGFAIVLYTADDKGNSKGEAGTGQLNDRARQNVVFEHGYLMAKLGRDRVVPLVNGRIELPGDISGMVYVSDTDWQIDIAKEMKSAGYPVDFNKLI